MRPSVEDKRATGRTWDVMVLVQCM